MLVILFLTLFTTAQAFELKEVHLDRGHWNFKEKFGIFKVEGELLERCKWIIKGEDLVKKRANTCQEELELSLDNSKLSLKTLNSKKNDDYRLKLFFKVNPKNYFYGLGSQYSHLTLNGKKFPILSQEQGNGRGREPFSRIQNLVASGLAGDEMTTYAASPIVLSSQKEALVIENYSYGVIDFRKKDQVVLSLLSDEASLYFFKAQAYPELFKMITNHTGRMRALPDWVHRGLIVGLTGGEKIVQEKLTALEGAGVPIVGVWLQDWVGVRQTTIGERLIWDWQRDEDRYPSYLSGKDHRVLGYFNPFLVKLPKDVKRKESLFDYAKSKDYLLKVDGKLHGTKMGGFQGYLVDLFNPKAKEWYKEIIQEKVKSEKFKGWMADFGEAWPFDAEISDESISQKDAHHRYIEAWNELNREVVESLEDDELTFFSRSSYLKGPKHSTLFWLGDQMTTWDHHDGIQSALIGLLSSGLTGAVFNHSDIGGYASVCLGPLKCLFEREKELLYRWLEMNAFGVVMRTHEGLNPDKLYQVYSDKEALRWTALWTNVFKELFEYRKKYILEASQAGMPVVRAMFIHDDSDISYRLRDQYFLGEHLMVAPILEKRKKKRSVYFPNGRWTHLLTGQVIQSKGQTKEIIAPVGTPPVFVSDEFPNSIANKIRLIWKKSL